MLRTYREGLAFRVNHLDRRGSSLELFTVLTAVILRHRAVIAGALVTGNQTWVGGDEDRHAIDEGFRAATDSGFEDDLLADFCITFHFREHVRRGRAFNHEDLTRNGLAGLGHWWRFARATFTTTLGDGECQGGECEESHRLDLHDVHGWFPLNAW